METDKEVFRKWLTGTYVEYAHNGNFKDSINRENAIKAIKFSNEVLLFMEQHNIINPNLK